LGKTTLFLIPGLANIVNDYQGKRSAEEKLLLMEFLLHGLAEYSLVGKNLIRAGYQFKDLFGSMFNMSEDDNYEEYE